MVTWPATVRAKASATVVEILFEADTDATDVDPLVETAADTPPSNMNTETMWLIYGFIAIISPVGLLLAKGWMKKGFKVKHEESK